MSILKKFQQNGSILSAYNGLTPTPSVSSNSKKHDTYSINGIPKLSNLPTPSILDLNTLTPPQYLDNLPT